MYNEWQESKLIYLQFYIIDISDYIIYLKVFFYLNICFFWRVCSRRSGIFAERQNGVHHHEALTWRRGYDLHQPFPLRGVSCGA